MADVVNPKFPRREKRAKATRRTILDAARQLFITHGYGATTIQAIADEADVAVQTVYAQTAEQRRRAGATTVIDSVRKVGTLRAGLTRQRAIDILWLLNSPAVYRQLVRHAGWRADDYQAWLADTMTTQLLDDDMAEPPPSPS